MIRIFVFILLCYGHNLLKAHPVSISWVKGRISGTQLTLSYRMLAEDLILYYQPSYNDHFDYSVKELEKLAISHKKYIEQYFILRTDEGSVKLTNSKIIGNTLPDKESVNVMDLMKYEVTYQFIYEIKPNWKSLSFSHQFQEIKSNLPVVCYLTLFDQQLVLVENQEITPEPFIVQRDIPVKLKNPSLQTSSFITIGLNGVHHELTIPSESLMSIMGVSTKNEINPISIERYLQGSQNRVVADGRDLKVNCTEYIILTDMNNGTIYVNLYYPYLKLPSKMEVTWADYNWRLRWFDSHVRTMNSRFDYRFTRYQPTILLDGLSVIEKKD